MMKTGLGNINKPAFLGNNVSFTQKLPYSWAFVTEEMPKGGYGFVIKKNHALRASNSIITVKQWKQRELSLGRLVS